MRKQEQAHKRFEPNVLEDKNKSTLHLTNEVLTETKT
jgi:hypothetical protein